MIDAGQNYRWTLDVTDTSGAPANATTITLTITLPDGTTVTPAVTNPPAQTGHYVYDYLTVQAGLHKAAAAITPVTLNLSPATDYFDVRQFISVISLAEAKKHLNKTRATDDDEIRNFLQACTELVESKVGVCVRRTFTDRVSDGTWQIVLPRRPILSVTSVTSVWPGGPAWTSSQLIPDLEAGIIMPATPLFPFWWGPWDVVSVAGRTQIPERFLHAVKEQLRHLWDTQRGGQPPALLQGEEIYTTTSGWSFSVPRRVLELLEQDMVPSA